MNSNEWPLVFFTILSQISLGIIFSAFALSLFLKDAETPALADLKKILIIVALSLTGIALIISFLHLASPQHSVYAISNIHASWLSREILLAVMYFLSLLLCFTALQYNIPHRNLFNYFFLASLVIGIIKVWSMAGVYMIPTVPLWNSPATPVAFFNTSLMLGSSALLAIIMLMINRSASFPEIKLMHSVLFFLIAASVFLFLLNKMFLQPDVSSVEGGFAAPFVAGWIKTAQNILIIAGFTLLTYWFSSYSYPVIGNKPMAALFVYFSVVFLLLAEIAGRYIFYASYYRIGV